MAAVSRDVGMLTCSNLSTISLADFDDVSPEYALDSSKRETGWQTSILKRYSQTYDKERNDCL